MRWIERASECICGVRQAGCSRRYSHSTQDRILCLHSCAAATHGSPSSSPGRQTGLVSRLVRPGWPAFTYSGSIAARCTYTVHITQYSRVQGADYGLFVLLSFRVSYSPRVLVPASGAGTFRQASQSLKSPLPPLSFFLLHSPSFTHRRRCLSLSLFPYYNETKPQRWISE